MRPFIKDRPSFRMAFARAHFYRHVDIPPQPPEIVSKWIDLAELVCERKGLLIFAEHYLYIGRKNTTVNPQ